MILAIPDIKQRIKFPILPPPRDAVFELGGFVAGEAEADEPLLVEVLRHLLQHLDPPVVDLDQVVVGGEDGGDFFLQSGIITNGIFQA